MTKKQKCPSCGKRIFDIARENISEIEIEMKCPHCHKIIKIALK